MRKFSRLAKPQRRFLGFGRARYAGPKEGPFVLEPQARKRVSPARPGGYDGPLAMWYAWRDDAGRHEEAGPSLLLDEQVRPLSGSASGPGARRPT